MAAILFQFFYLMIVRYINKSQQTTAIDEQPRLRENEMNLSSQIILFRTQYILLTGFS